MPNETAARIAAGRSDDLGEPRARPDRVRKPAPCDIGSAPALGAHEAARGQLGERTPDRMPVDAETDGDLDLAGKTLAGRVGSERNRLLEVIGDPAPQGDAVRGRSRSLRPHRFPRTWSSVIRVSLKWRSKLSSSIDNLRAKSNCSS